MPLAIDEATLFRNSDRSGGAKPRETLSTIAFPPVIQTELSIRFALELLGAVFS
jgi:hypothetical protein